MRKRCTKENPSDHEPWKWYHPDAVFTGNCFDGYYVWEDSWEEFECPHCKEIFKETISK